MTIKQNNKRKIILLVFTSFSIAFAASFIYLFYNIVKVLPDLTNFQTLEKIAKVKQDTFDENQKKINFIKAEKLKLKDKIFDETSENKRLNGLVKVLNINNSFIEMKNEKFIVSSRYYNLAEIKFTVSYKGNVEVPKTAQLIIEYFYKAYYKVKNISNNGNEYTIEIYK